MKERDIHILRCPATRTSMQLKIISLTKKIYDNCEEDIINEGILFSEGGWIYPVIGGIPRLLIEAFEDYRSFFYKYLPDYKERKSLLQNKYKGLVRYAINKNRRTKKSFSQEWKLYDFEKDKTWNEDAPGMLQRFFK